MSILNYQTYILDDEQMSQPYLSDKSDQSHNIMHHSEEFPNSQLSCEKEKGLGNAKKKSFKNLPKLIANNYCKYVQHNCKQIPNGAQNLIDKRKKTKQYFTKISDLREACQTDQYSQKIFKKYIKKQLFVDLIFSSRIQNPLLYAEGLSNYYAASEEPEKMISSQLKQTKY